MITPDSAIRSGVNFRSDIANSVSPKTNQYNISYQFLEPNEFIDLSSTTSSQPSIPEFIHFSQISSDLLSGLSYSELYDSIKSNLSSLLNVPSESLIFTPSGSDCDAIGSLLLSCQTSNIHFVNILPEEAGRLSVRFQILDIDKSDLFSSFTFFGDYFQSLSDISKYIECTSSTLSLNNGLSLANYDLLLDELYAKINDSPGDCTIVLRSIFCSKTGLCFPSIDDMATIKEKYGNKIKIFVDCCQFRLLKSEFDALLGVSDAIFLSFSKFFQAPAFAGVVVLGEELSNLYSLGNCTEQLTNSLRLFSITKQSLSVLKSSSQLPTFYDCIAVLMKLDLGVSRLSQYFSFDESLLIENCAIYNRLVSNVFSTQIVKPSEKFSSKVSNSISLLRLMGSELTGREIYNALCSLYIKKRILVGQPVDSCFGGSNLRLSLGFRLMAAPDFDLINDHLKYTKSCIDFTLRLQ